jgi:hypothetical protein
MYEHGEPMQPNTPLSMLVLKDGTTGLYCRFHSYRYVSFTPDPLKATHYSNMVQARKRADEIHYPKNENTFGHGGPIGAGEFSIVLITFSRWEEEDVS